MPDPFAILYAIQPLSRSLNDHVLRVFHLVFEIAGFVVNIYFPLAWDRSEILNRRMLLKSERYKYSPPARPFVDL